jgi:hypothetical protein
MFVFEVIGSFVYVKLLYPQKGDPAGIVKQLKFNIKIEKG